MSILNRNNVVNGRIDLTNVFPSKSFSLYDEPNSGNQYFKDDALKGIQIKSHLSRVFFSKENIDILQNTIIQTVYSKFNHQILVHSKNSKDETSNYLKSQSIYEMKSDKNYI